VASGFAMTDAQCRAQGNSNNQEEGSYIKSLLARNSSRDMQCILRSLPLLW